MNDDVSASAPGLYPETQPEPASEPQPQPPTPGRLLRSTRAWVIAAICAIAAVALALVLALVVFAGGGVPGTLHGTVTSTVLSIGQGLSGETPSDCILNLPSQGSQLQLKAGGVTVSVAQLSGGFHTLKNKLGEVCSVNFTFDNVPGGYSLYEVTINVTNPVVGGCTGTIYYTPQKLATGKPLDLSCS